MKIYEKGLVIDLVNRLRVFESPRSLFHFSTNLFTITSSCCLSGANERRLIQEGRFFHFLPFFPGSFLS